MAEPRPAATAKPPVRIIDATLREGMQAPGVRFSAAASTEIARALARLGIDTVECGHPVVSDEETARVRAVRGALPDTPLLCHARARTEDVRAAAACGADWIGIFLGVNDSVRCTRLSGRTVEELLAMIGEAVALARGLGLRVRFTVEDTSRTDPEPAIRAYSAAVSAGAERICFADTTGVLEPGAIARRVGDLVAALPGVDVEVHCHDDRGLATANSLAAIDAGAGWVSTAVNGMGERCGITDLAALLANLDHRGARPITHPAILQDLSTRVAAYARAPGDPRRPVSGAHAFTHTARLHALAVERDPCAYEWTPPARLGRQHRTAGSGLPRDPAGLITRASAIADTELRHHRHGPGTRYVMIDERFVADCRQYCIVRRIPALNDYGEGHVDAHSHTCDSLFLFLGDGPELEGLAVAVTLGADTFEVDSPASVFIPSGVAHSYRIRAGSGLFINHVLSGAYDDSLLDPSEDRRPDQAWR